MDRLQELLAKYVPPIVGVVVLLAVAYVIAGWVAKLVMKALEKAKVDRTLSKFFGSAAKWSLMVLALIACLGVFGVETTSFAAVIGAAGLAIGLAFQGSLSNLSAGVMLLIFRPFKAGDVISVAGQLGKIDSIELFSTKMDTPDNRRVILPNSSVFGSVLENITYHETRRVDVSVGVEYGAEIDRARQVLTEAAKNVPDTLSDPPPQVILLELGDSSVNWQVRVWCKTEDYWTVLDAATTQVKVALDQAGIGIPFPQVDVHMAAQQG